jgi:glycerol-3-phosphate dehydrogenase
MISVAGGKLTTHRLIAVEALRRLPASVLPGAASIRPDESPLPGSGRPDLGPGAAGVDPEVRAHLIRVYGSRAGAVLAYADQDPNALEPIHPRGPDVMAQAAYAIDREWAMTVEDLARRRTTLALRGLAGEEVRARLREQLRRRGVVVN